VILISALPLLLEAPVLAIRLFKNKNLRHEFPPYYASALNVRMKKWVDKDEIVVSDQPWAVAWYADRMSLWLPAKKDGFNLLEGRADDLKTPFSGILISPASHGSRDLAAIKDEFNEFASLVMDGRGIFATIPNGVSLYEQDPNLSAISKTYRYRAALVQLDMIYYSEKPLRVDRP
jgi:hypothetical protein